MDSIDINIIARNSICGIGNGHKSNKNNIQRSMKKKYLLASYLYFFILDVLL